MSSTESPSEDVAGQALDSKAPLLAVDNLHLEFRIEDGIVQAVNGLSYSVEQGETLAILGESGSGKSVSAQAVMGILDSPPGFVTQGSVKFRGVELLAPNKKTGALDHVVPEVRGTRIAMVFQDALTALNPVFTVGWQIGEMFRVHQGASKKEAKEKAIEMMERVKIPSARERVNSYPYEFSGGMRQRVMIAMALSMDPEVMIADEPTTALDVTVQSQIMELLSELQQETGMGLILITHDLAVVADVADRVVVMYAGRRMETGGIDDIFHHPSHPYTLGLMDSIARPDVHVERLTPIPGSPPDLLAIPSGCPFHPRCTYAKDRCSTDVPVLESVNGQHESGCFYWREVQVEL
jgi:oligopeptide/dipeptide ABC transporter ATP-binding protein